MTDRRALRHLHALLKNKDRWYIEAHRPYVDILLEICNKAKQYADDNLSGLSFRQFYRRYKKWRADSPVLSLDGSVFDDFVNDLAWEMGKTPLKSEELDLYIENCYLKVIWI